MKASWWLLFAVGFGLKVYRNYNGDCRLNDTLELEDGLKWTGAKKVASGLDIARLPRDVVIPFNHEILDERLVFRKPQRVSEVGCFAGISPCVLKSSFDLNLTWGVAPSYGKELTFWKRFFSEMIPVRLMKKGYIPKPKLEVAVAKSTLQYIWLKSVAYEVDMLVHHYSDGSRWRVTGHFPLVSEAGELIGVYGLDEVCNNSLVDGLFPGEDDAPRLVDALNFIECNQYFAE
ncbi:hypothetical protein DSO57_1035036 [Entomophthora muscae]|uniref:Uncharacterized protein n=1 Tax=Entomophthora muscae TaxID=34485 RepID=A0ACC2TLE6_9FUNG|nr:hypothetical protein DSO57_1035036 [Entomophthora muscae]